MALKKPIKKPSNKIQKEVNNNNQEIRLLSDRDHVRLRKGVYIPNINYTVYELVDNAVDEYLNGYGKEIQVKLNEYGVVSVLDNGRGLPVEQSKDEPEFSQAELAFSRLKAGSKFTGEVKSTGLNGIGSSGINFLSEYFEVEIYKDGNVYDLAFKKGIIDRKLKIVDSCDKNFHGTYVECKPDPEIWKEEDYDIDAINNRIKQICYLNPDLTIKLDIDYKDRSIHESYNFPNGLRDYVEELVANKEAIHDAWYYDTTTSLSEKETCDISIAFAYTESYTDTIYGFANNVSNRDQKSSNITGFKRGIAAALKEAYESEYPKSKLNLTAEDTREGIVAIVSIKAANLEYIGQGKDLLSMPKVASAVYNVTKEFVEDQFDKLPNEKDNILNRVAEAARVREASRKAKETARKTKGTFTGKVEGLTKCKSTNPYERSIWLVEGKHNCFL